MSINRRSSGRCCAVFNCHNNWRKLQDWKQSECEIHSPWTHEACLCVKPYSLHRFPGRDEGMRRQWIKNINRKDFKVKKHSVVCGIHFPDGKPTEAHPYPVLHMGYDPHKRLSTGRAPPKRRCLQQESETSTSEEEHGHVESSQEVEDEEENEEVQPLEDNITVMTYLSVSSALLVTDVDLDAVLSRAQMFSTESGRTFCVVDLFHKQAKSVQATPV